MATTSPKDFSFKLTALKTSPNAPFPNKGPKR